MNFYSTNFDELGIISSSIDCLGYNENEYWVNYPKGVIAILKAEGYNIDHGFDIVYHGTIPNGAGLSSSASIEVVTAWMLNTLFNFGLSMVECALLSQKAENQFVGVNSGIMDQFASGLGQKDNAILLNTNTLEYKYIPVELDNHSIVICNTNKRRGLNESKYNDRRAQCEAALVLLQKEVDIQAICELSFEQLESLKHLIPDEEMYRRVKHAVTENERTLKASQVLQENNLAEFGRLMNQSHVSLRDDYEVTGIELDTMVESAWKQPGIIGARVTGAGFGGCAIAIVENDKIDDFIQNVGADYLEKIGYQADFYVASVGAGAHEIL